MLSIAVASDFRSDIPGPSSGILRTIRPGIGTAYLWRTKLNLMNLRDTRTDIRIVVGIPARVGLTSDNRDILDIPVSFHTRDEERTEHRSESKQGE